MELKIDTNAKVPTVKIEGGLVHLTIPLLSEPKEKDSGNLVIATTGGTLPTNIRVNGRILKVSAFAMLGK